MKFDRAKFFAGYREKWGSLTQQQVNGLEQLLTSIENDPHITDVRWAAYMLGTTRRETAYTFQPIHEYGSHNYFVNRYGGQTALGHRLGNDTPEEGALYAGVGDVQLTGESNFERAEAALPREYPEVIARWEAQHGKKFDLTVGDQPNDERDPQNAGDPEIAYIIMSYGMRTGMFTGKKLSDYINARGTDYVNARKIINGLDHAALIAGDAVAFEKMLRAANISAATLADIPTPALDEQPPLSSGPATDVAAEPNSDPLVAEQPPTEVTKTVEKQTEVGKETVEVTGKNEQDVNTPAEVEGVKPYNEIGLKQTLINDAKPFLPANGGLQMFSEYAQQATGWPAWVVGLIGKAALILLVITTAWVLYRVVSWLVHTWRENERVKLLAQINSDVARKNVELV